MRKSLIAVVLFTLTLFGAGYIVGQVRGVAASNAATNGPTVFNAGPIISSSAARSIAKHADGTVTAINGDTVTVKADNDASNSNEYRSVTTIQLTSSTQYNVTGGKSAIKVGSHILAEGTVSSDGKALTAAQVSVGGHGGCPNGASSNGATPGSTTSSLNT